MGLYRILYSSKALDTMKESEVFKILETAQQKNKSKGITGLLLFINGNFIQLIEGEENEILELYSKIQLDPRHNYCKILSEGRISNKDFETWDMGLKVITKNDMEELKMLNNNNNFDLFETLNNKSGIALEMMKHFYVHGEIKFEKFWRELGVKNLTPPTI